LQIVGRKGVDELVCAIAACFEACFEDSFAQWTETA
jgi:amidase